RRSELTAPPYTTLFRSDRHRPREPQPGPLRLVHAVRGERQGDAEQGAVGQGALSPCSTAESQRTRRRKGEGGGEGGKGKGKGKGDRKSTRLNSSHVKIS